MDLKIDISGLTYKIDKEDLVQARKKISEVAHITPVLSSVSLNKILGANLFFKCENFQKTGSFKIRGASNAILSLSQEEIKNGVATHSSGNHAQAVAYAAKRRGITAHIVMPKNSAQVKVEAVKGYGGKITWSEPDQCSREDTLDLVKNTTGAAFIHPYDNDKIIAGQSTAMQELLEQVDIQLDAIIAPIGGGGLMSGTALASREFSPKTKIFGSEPALASDAYESFKSGKLVLQKPPLTIADGLRTGLGRRNFEIITSHLDEIFLVEEEEILEAMKLVWERMKIIIEPSCAVPVAAIKKNAKVFSGKKVGIILTGGNVDLKQVGNFFKD